RPGTSPAQGFGETPHSFVEGRVRALAPEQVEDVLAQGLRVHGVPFRQGDRERSMERRLGAAAREGWRVHVVAAGFGQPPTRLFSGSISDYNGCLIRLRSRDTSRWDRRVVRTHAPRCEAARLRARLRRPDP